MSKLFKNWSRSTEIYLLRMNGATFKEIGGIFGITGVRARQIVNRLERMRQHPSREGQALEDFFAEYQDPPPPPSESDLLAKDIQAAQALLKRKQSLRQQAERTLALRQEQERVASAHLSALRSQLESIQQRKEK